MRFIHICFIALCFINNANIYSINVNNVTGASESSVVYEQEICSLHDCFDENHVQLVKLVPKLIESGLDPNEMINNEPVLHKAIRFSKHYHESSLWIDFIKALNSLAAAGVDLDKQYNDRTAMQFAFDLYPLVPGWGTNECSLEGIHLAQIIEPFLLTGFDPNSVYKKEKVGLTNNKSPIFKEISFLEEAIRKHVYEVSDLILGDNKLDKNKDVKFCFKHFDLRSIRKLMSRNQFHVNSPVWLMFEERIWTPEYVDLSRKQHKALFTLAIESGGFVCKYDDSQQGQFCTPLHDAVRLGNGDIIELMIKNGAIQDLEKKDWKGRTPFLFGILCQKGQSCICLAKHGADLNVLDSFDCEHGMPYSVYISKNTRKYEILFKSLHENKGKYGRMIRNRILHPH